MSSRIVQVTTRALTPPMILLSFYLLLRGHDQPGGGFIAGLVAGGVVVLRYLAYGVDALRRFLPMPFTTLLSWGLLIATGFGIAGLVGGAEFLSGTVWAADLPVVGELKVAASLIFDIGVYLVVLSMVVAVVRNLGREGV